MATETIQKPRKEKTRGNGQGTAFKRGNTWTAQVTNTIEKDENGKITKRTYKSKGGFKTKREALAYCSELINGVVIGSAITFAGLYDLWSKEHYPKVSDSQERGYKAAYAKCDSIYQRQFASLKTADLQKLIDNAKALQTSNKSKAGNDELGRRGKENIRSLFSNMYSYAIKNDVVDKDYSTYIELDKKVKPKKDAFTDAEIEALFSDYNAGNEFTGYILILIYTGMRYGEISTIKKDKMHLDEHYMIGGIKSEAGIDRQIPICDKIYSIVEKFYHQRDKKLLEISEKMFYTQYYFALERLGLRKLAPHCCRHTTATALAKAGVAPAVIIAILGHEDYTTTLKNYTHIKLEEMLAAVNKL